MPILTQCLVCQSPFETTPTRLAAGRGKCCSRACATQYTAALNTLPLLQTCLICGRPMHVKPSQVAKGAGKYCSRACKHAAMRGPDNACCDVCGRPFHISPYRQRSRWGRYCSEACQRSLNGMARRFWRKVAICQHGRTCPYCCWEWTGVIQLSGYGSVVRNKASFLTHRIAWELWHERTIPTGLWACHYCHRRSCCNPMHLHVGTAQDNMDDSMRDGRMPRGEATVMHVLTLHEVRDIRAQHAAGTTMYRLARLYGLGKGHVRDIVTRKIWKHVP